MVSTDFQLYLHKYFSLPPIKQYLFPLKTLNTSNWNVFELSFLQGSRETVGLFRQINMIWLSLPQALLSPSVIDCQSKLVDHLQEKEGQKTPASGRAWLYYYLPGPLSLTFWLHIHTRYENVDYSKWWISSFILQSQIWWPAACRTVSSFIRLSPYGKLFLT